MALVASRGSFVSRRRRSPAAHWSLPPISGTEKRWKKGSCRNFRRWLYYQRNLHCNPHGEQSSGLPLQGIAALRAWASNRRLGIMTTLMEAYGSLSWRHFQMKPTRWGWWGDSPKANSWTVKFWRPRIWVHTYLIFSWKLTISVPSLRIFRMENKIHDHRFPSQLIDAFALRDGSKKMITSEYLFYQIYYSPWASYFGVPSASDFFDPVTSHFNQPGEAAEATALSVDLALGFIQALEARYLSNDPWISRRGWGGWFALLWPCTQP